MVDEKEAADSVMTRKVFNLKTAAKTIDALDLMIKKDVGSVVVMERGKLYGIITERDIVRKITRDFEYLNRPLKDTATRPVTTISPDTPLWEAFAILLRKKIRRLPVMTGGKLVGIVTERDLFKWVVRIAYEPNVPNDIRKLITQSK